VTRRRPFATHALRALRAQDGVTMIEVLIGAVCAVVVISAVAVGTASNSTASLATQRQAQLVALLQSRIENLHQLFTETYGTYGFNAFALSKNPENGEDSSLPTNPRDPNDFITPWIPSLENSNGKSTEGYLIENNYNNTAEGTVEKTHETEPLLVNATTGKIPPVAYVDLTTGKSYSLSSEVPSSDPYAIVNTYITVASVAESSNSTNCPTTNGTATNEDDARRVIVAARLVPVAGHRRTETTQGKSTREVSTDLGASTPQYITALFTNPVPSNQCQTGEGLLIGLGV
jgi:Tfp pilus assembly protein PilW